jgi:hypothetical protein
MPVPPAEGIRRQVIPGDLKRRAPAPITGIRLIAFTTGALDRLSVIFEVF